METPTTLNIGEPTDERSVDGNSRPFGEHSDGGDHAPSVKEVCGNQSTGKTYRSRSRPIMTFPDYETGTSPDFPPFRNCDYEDDEDEEESLPLFPKIHMTLRDILFKIVPSLGAASYEYFSLKIMSPTWFLRAFSGMDQTVGNMLWLQSHVGIGLYVFSRRHFRSMPLSRGILYSIFGSFLFNYGSCLFWALGKNYLPSVPAVQVGFGLITGGILLFVGQDYLHYIDKTCSEVE